MKKSIVYHPIGVCSQQIEVETENGIIRQVIFTGGCSGNTQGISLLVQGMTVDEAIARLEGIQCRDKGTSCPDQLAQALKSL